MKSNSLLTYILYGLLGLFILAASYYACQKQREKKEAAAREQLEMDETVDKYGYGATDSTTNGSVYTSTDSVPKTTATKPTTTTTKPNTITTVKPTTTKPTTTTNVTKPKPKGKGVSVKGPGSGRWAVRAGTFDYMEGARRRLEEVIRAGYPNAEISKTAEGKAAVVVFRSNDKNAAIRIVDDLEEKGFDAAVFARK
ncbi:MAG: hypothetical protein ACKVUS_07995 [Saprospiraceae bacterium]